MFLTTTDAELAIGELMPEDDDQRQGERVRHDQSLRLKSRVQKPKRRWTLTEPTVRVDVPPARPTSHVSKGWILSFRLESKRSKSINGFASSKTEKCSIR